MVKNLKFNCDLKGILHMSFIILYWIYGSWSALFVILIPHYKENHISLLSILVFSVISLFCILSLFRATMTNPGKVPDSQFYEPESNNVEHFGIQVPTQPNTYCDKCKKKKPDRAHHCKRCKQCVLKMDHHCPWINNCVGEANQFAFLQLLFYAVLLSGVVFLSGFLHYWILPEREVYNDDDPLYIYQNYFIIILMCMGVSMGLACFALFASQIFLLVADKTTIETMQAGSTGFIPLNSLPAARSVPIALSDVCGQGPFWTYFFPCRTKSSNFSYENLQSV